MRKIRYPKLINPEALVLHPYICITGDTHGDIDWEKLNTEHFPEQRQMDQEDILIIAGDFGCVWHRRDEYGNEHKSDKYLLNAYENRKFTTVFIDGNHENHEALAEYPKAEFLGAECHQTVRMSIMSCAEKSFISAGIRSGAWAVRSRMTKNGERHLNPGGRGRSRQIKNGSMQKRRFGGNGRTLLSRMRRRARRLIPLTSEAPDRRLYRNISTAYWISLQMSRSL
jgi:hypothetical protein